MQLFIIIFSQILIYLKGTQSDDSCMDKFFMFIGLGRIWVSSKSLKNKKFEKIEQILKFEEYCFESLPSILLQLYILVTASSSSSQASIFTSLFISVASSSLSIAFMLKEIVVSNDYALPLNDITIQNINEKSPPPDIM